MLVNAFFSQNVGSVLYNSYTNSILLMLSETVSTERVDATRVCRLPWAEHERYTALFWGGRNHDPRPL